MKRLFGPPSFNYVALVVSKEALMCGWLQKSNQTGTLCLLAYEKTFLTSCFDKQTFFNPTHIGAIITNFLTKNKIKNAHVSCAFTNHLITERLSVRTNASPLPQELKITHTQHSLWDYHYLYPTDTNEYVFYVCSVTQAFLLQYKLIALMHALSLLTTTSQTSALLHLYRYVHGTAFRAAQLSIDMQRSKNNIENLFNLDILNRILSISSSINIIPAQEKSALLTMCGLFVSERMS